MEPSTSYTHEWYSLKTLRADARELDKWGYIPAPWQVDRVKENSIEAITQLTESLTTLASSSHYVAQDAINNEIVGIRRVLKALQKKYPQNFI